MRILLLLVLVGPCLQGCSAGRHYRTDAATFVRLAGSGVGSAVDVAFVGSAGGRVYLRRWSALPWVLGGGEDIYSVALEDLPAEWAERIRAGQNPWAREAQGR
jgi:hypothetical protein